MKEKRETVGKIVTDLLKKYPDTRDPQELQKAMAQDYEKTVLNTFNEGKKIYQGDFFVVSLCKKEKMLPNVFRNLIHHRSSCPTPTYDQTIYHYSFKDDALFFLWSIPDRETCITFKENALQIVPEEKWLRDIIIDFYDGTLDKLCDEFNGKKSDIILYKKKKGEHEQFPRVRSTSRNKKASDR